MREYEGTLEARGLRFAIVASRFNDFIVEALVRGAEGAIVRLGGRSEDIDLYRVPGALELATVASRAASSARYEAVICLGAVIRGATPHFEHVAGQAAREVCRLAAESEVPVIFGVITTDTVEQAIERAGTKAGNKGAEAAIAAVEMARLFQSMGGVDDGRGSEDGAGFSGKGTGGLRRGTRTRTGGE